MDYLYLALSALATAACVVFTSLVAYIALVHQRYSHIPGPPRASFFTGNVSQYADAAKQGGTPCMQNLEWAKIYGKTFVVWNLYLPMVITCDQEAVKQFMVSGGHPKSEMIYSALSYVFGSRVFGKSLGATCDEKVWSPQRKDIEPGFNTVCLKDMSAQLNDILNEMVDYLATLADGVTPVKLGALLNRVTLDFITRAALGVDVGSMKDELHPFPAAVQELMNGIHLQTHDPFVARKFWKGYETKRRSQTAVNLVRSQGAQWLAERKDAIDRNEHVPNDLLTILAKTIAVHGDEVAVDNIINIVIGGQETTANALALAFLELNRHPDIANAMRKEVDDILGTKSYITVDEVAQLDLTGRVFKETLRVYPVSPHHYRQVGTEDFNIAGMPIPKGTNVNVSEYVAHHYPGHCPDDATFNPDRFRDDSDLHPKPYTYFPFLIGPRTCIAKRLVKIEAVMLLAKLMQRFELHVDPGQRYGFYEQVTMCVHDGLQCTITERRK